CEPAARDPAHGETRRRRGHDDARPGGRSRRRKDEPRQRDERHRRARHRDDLGREQRRKAPAPQQLDQAHVPILPGRATIRGCMTRSAAAAVLLAALSLTLAGATHATTASGDCAPAGGKASVKRPQFVRNIPTGETGWFASPSLVDLNGDGKLEIVAPF